MLMYLMHVFFVMCSRTVDGGGVSFLMDYNEKEDSQPSEGVASLNG